MILLDRAALGRDALALLEALARFTEPGRPGVTRLPLSPEHAAAASWLGGEMRATGLEVRLDAAATLIGRLDGAAGPGARTLLLGSHLDSVREGGRFDGALGVVLPLVALRALARAGARLPFAVEVLAFADEEGVRFPDTLTGSRALAGALPPGACGGRDADGVAFGDALRAFGGDPDGLPALRRDPAGLLGYVEAHIEQGPVLEAAGLPVGVVTAIADAARYAARFSGEAGHAGTVPMGRRRDALAGAAEAVLAAERAARAAGASGAVATVGTIEALPGAGNVILGAVGLSLDLRAPSAEGLARLEAEVGDAWREVASRRGLGLELEATHRAAGCAMDGGLSARLEAAVASAGVRPLRLPSGAGHDAMALAALTPVAMLFVRCRGGVSHRPDEHVGEGDLGVAAEVLVRFLEGLAAG